MCTVSLTAVLLLAGCGGGTGDSGESTVRLLLTDAPAADLAEVHVHITQIQAVGTGGPVVLLDDAQIPDDIELVALAANPLLLGQPLIPPGDYTQVRLILSDVAGQNWIKLAGGATHNLTIPSGPQTGAKLVTGPFTVTPGGALTILMDFNAAASVHQAGNSGNWIMRPTIFATVGDDSSPDLGSVAGTVLTDLAAALVPPTGQVLGVFVEGSFGLVGVAQASSTDGSFTIPTLLAGTYTLRLYYADQDYIPQGSALTFTYNGGAAADSTQVVVTAGGTTTATIVVPTA